MTLFFCESVFAHDQHSEELKSKPPISGSSVYQLESEWKDQRGKSLSLLSLRGNPRLVVMLFTMCETACPLIVEDLKEIASEIDAKTKNKIEVSIFSLDSFRETPKTLAEFALKRDLPANWSLFTSKSEAVAELAAALGVRYKRLASGDYIHSNVIYFLNGDGEVLAQKEGIKSPRVDFLKKIIPALRR